MNTSITLPNDISIRFTEPHDSRWLFTLSIGDTEATISAEDAGKLYTWLESHRISFTSFYGEGWKLAHTYYEAEGAPDNYYSMVALFNAHCHEIKVAPFHEGDTGPSELAINGFIAWIHEAEYQRAQESEETRTYMEHHYLGGE